MYPVQFVKPILTGLTLFLVVLQARAESRTVFVQVAQNKDKKVLVAIHSDEKKERKFAVSVDEAVKVIGEMQGWGSSVGVYVTTDWRSVPRADVKTLLVAVLDNCWLDLAYFGPEGEAPKVVRDHYPLAWLLRNHLANAISKDDPIYPILSAYQAAIEKRYEEGKYSLPIFREWTRVDSPAAAKLFPKLQFASIKWDERRHPEAKDHPVALAGGLEVTVAIDTTTKRIVKELRCWGNYEDYGKLLVDHRIRLRDAAEAKLVYDALCDIHHNSSKTWPIKKISASEWHLGISRHDETKSVVDRFKTVVTETYYFKVLVDPKTGRITSGKSEVPSSDERKVPTK